MKKFSTKEILIPTVVLFLIALVCSGLLALTNHITAPEIEKIQLKNEIATRQIVFPGAENFGEEKTIVLDGSEYTYVEALDESGKTAGYIFTTSAAGYGGEVRMMTGINDADGKITGVETLLMSETTGLGMNAKKESFRSQYIGSSGAFTVVKNAPKNNEIQALTGATITSNAVTECVNKAISLYENIKGGAENG